MQSAKLSFLAILSLSFTGVAQTEFPTGTFRPLMSASPAAQSTTAAVVGAMRAPSGYTLSANDQVAIEVFGEEDLRTNGRLNGEGNLSLPLLGSVHLGGLTLAQAASRITELYGRDYLVNPKVNITLVGYAKRRFSIL